MLKHISVMFVSVLILLALFLACPFSIYARDSTSYNPKNVPVSVQAGGGVPIGTIIAWPVATDPPDAHKWLECNGQSITDSNYQELRTLLGSNNVPNYQGMFLRGFGSQYNDFTGFGLVNHSSGNLVGKIQGDSIREVYGEIPADMNEYYLINYRYSGPFRYVYGERASTGGTLGGQFHAVADFRISRATPTDNEIRPVNIAVRYLIKALK